MDTMTDDTNPIYFVQTRLAFKVVETNSVAFKIQFSHRIQFAACPYNNPHRRHINILT